MELNMSVVLLIAIPLFAAALSLLTSNNRVLHVLNLATMVALVVATLSLFGPFREHGSFTALWNLVYVDALSLFILSIVTIIGLSCSLYMWTYFDDEGVKTRLGGRRLNQFFPLYHLFVFSMIVATLANSLGVQWVAIEATTLTTVFLITFFKSQAGLEAGWKYLILCSVGIALALFGTVLTYYSSISVLGEENAALNITGLLPVADQLDGHVLKLAFIFVLVGYGTKIGLVPMHTWLPEAYSEAPAPITAMLAGVLETVAVYAVLRNKSIVDQALSTNFTGTLLLVAGLVSFGTAALFMLIQRDYKRLFAYSSIEHMGLAMVGFGVGGATGTFAGLFHLLNHALAKSMGFFALGNVFRRYQTRKISEVQGIAISQPITAFALLVGGLALVGMPPFSMFNSEILVFSSLANMNFGEEAMHLGQFVTIIIPSKILSLGVLSGVLILAIALFGGFVYRLCSMVWGTPHEKVLNGEAWNIGHIPLMATAAALVLLAFNIPAPLKTLFHQATLVLTGG